MDVRENVIKYLKTMSEPERKRLKTMVKNGVTCCVGYAKDLNIDPDDFNAELRRIYS